MLDYLKPLKKLIYILTVVLIGLDGNIFSHYDWSVQAAGVKCKANSISKFGLF